MGHLPKRSIERIADYFQALADPTRLRVLGELEQGERSVGELALVCGCSSANISRHLGVLCQQGLIERSARGTSAYHRLADPSLRALYELACGSIARHEQAARAFAAPAGPHFNLGEKP